MQRAHRAGANAGPLVLLLSGVGRREEPPQRLKNVVSGHAAGRGRDEAALRSAAYALCYPANPYDAVFDAHQDLGLEDDCEVVARVAERLERREKRARMTVGRGLVEAPGGALTR